MFLKALEHFKCDELTRGLCPLRPNFDVFSMTQVTETFQWMWPPTFQYARTWCFWPVACPRTGWRVPSLRRKHQNSAATGTALLSTNDTLSALASQWALETLQNYSMHEWLSRLHIECGNSTLKHSCSEYDIIKHQATLLTPSTVFYEEIC